ncbi:hypothetical protein PATA110615_11050 [Paenibacillus taichungensis]
MYISNINDTCEAEKQAKFSSSTSHAQIYIGSGFIYNNYSMHFSNHEQAGVYR